MEPRFFLRGDGDDGELINKKMSTVARGVMEMGGDMTLPAR
jgi:hypothetical protein